MTDALQIAPADRAGPLPRVVLASESPSRAAVLRQAGIPALCDAARIDEAEVKASLAGEGATAAQVAETLAEMKARKVALRHPGALVIGADQMLDCEGTWFDKPQSLEEAEGHLLALSGKTHSLLTCACVVRDDARLWHHLDQPRLTVRPLSRDFVAAYLQALGPAALTSVGAYQLEGLGAQLFARITGDFFAILGLPLLPLMDFLRAQGALRT